MNYITITIDNPTHPRLPLVLRMGVMKFACLKRAQDAGSLLRVPGSVASSCQPGSDTFCGHSGFDFVSLGVPFLPCPPLGVSPPGLFSVLSFLLNMWLMDFIM